MRLLAFLGIAAGSAAFSSWSGTIDEDAVLAVDAPPAMGTNDIDIYLTGLADALKVMQDTWFEIWLGTWPTAIDWTAAVLASHVTSALESLSKIESSPWGCRPAGARLENQIQIYYDQLAAFYFAENVFALRNEANDDMLWVNLNWLDTAIFTTAHSNTFKLQSGGVPWHGAQYVPGYTHRADVFYNLAAKGWNTTLCNGGMVWNDKLTPYKNAITNELYIAASGQMYLYYSNDNNTSPYQVEGWPPRPDPGRILPGQFNETYRQNAIKGYRWLSESNMTNSQSLYVDGFHITGWKRTNRTGTGKCDERNNMVYTYNQGVLLTGLRDLWEATGNTSYLFDAHALVEAVITATGWTGPDMAPNRTWAGLGRSGILEDFCDHNQTCNQDAQTFKGIYMQNLARLCHSLPPVARRPGKTYGAPRLLNVLHLNSCRSYAPWVRHNAAAANATRDSRGRFGMWWAAGLFNASDISTAAPPTPPGAIDYFSISVPADDYSFIELHDGNQLPLGVDRSSAHTFRDPNSRGRGRTVETQSGGLAVMRAAWELSRL